MSFSSNRVKKFLRGVSRIQNMGSWQLSLKFGKDHVWLQAGVSYIQETWRNNIAPTITYQTAVHDKLFMIIL